MVTLYDQFEQPIDLDALKEEKAAPSLTGVRSVLSGHPSQGLTPKRLASILRESEAGDPFRYLELAEDMEEKDLHYLAVLSTRKRQVSQLTISVEPASDSADDVRNAEFLQNWLDREALEEELFDILDAIGKGYSITEIIWEFSERQWWPARLEHRDPRWFRFDPADGRTPMLRNDDGTLSHLDPFKFVCHFHRAKSGLPIRGGLARAAGWAYLFKNYDIKGWMAFAEVFGQPLRVGKFHPGATEEERAKLLSAVANIGRDAAAIIPQGMEIEFIKTEVRGNTDLYERLANFMDLQLSKAVLGQTTTTDAVSGGHAVSKEHNEVREDIERSDAKQLGSSLNRDLGRPFIDLNFGPQKVYPRFLIGRDEVVDMEQLSQALERTVPLGLRVSQSEVRSKFGLKEPDKDDEILGAPDGEGQDRVKALAREGDHSDDSIDTLIEEALSADWEEIMDPIVGPVTEMVDGAKSLEEIRERLAGHIGEMDSAKLTDLLARAGFSSRLAGELDVSVDDTE